ncbi:MAG: hypothetical protein GIW99_10170 [Candidatus Eremiobacteraeota bacterium]|nr:hypothetical protein [Candidatus Eremiobacteraeota bacterium]MBC5828028.1 hypothetical protein [Candidatus Eremiobacteraeota bacterium]
MISPPSEGLLGGYQMHAKDSKQFELLGVRISDFQKDATYSPVAKTMEGHLAETMSNGSSGPITLQLIPSGQQLPVQLIDMPKTKLDITISDNGMKGEARFTNLESPMDMKAMTAKMGQAMGAALKQSTGGPQGLPPLRREPQASRNLNSSQAPSPGRVPRWTASTRRRSIRCSITLCRPPRARKVREAG